MNYIVRKMGLGDLYVNQSDVCWVERMANLCLHDAFIEGVSRSFFAQAFIEVISFVVCFRRLRLGDPPTLVPPRLRLLLVPRYGGSPKRTRRKQTVVCVSMPSQPLYDKVNLQTAKTLQK